MNTGMWTNETGNDSSLVGDKRSSEAFKNVHISKHFYDRLWKPNKVQRSSLSAEKLIKADVAKASSLQGNDRSVRFCLEKNSIYPLLRSSGCVQNTWISKKEEQYSQQEMLSSSHQDQTDCFDDTTTRGMEHVMNPSLLREKIHRGRLIRRAILQARREPNGNLGGGIGSGAVEGMYAVSLLAMQLSAPDVQEALEAGLRDMADAMNVHFPSVVAMMKTTRGEEARHIEADMTMSISNICITTPTHRMNKRDLEIGPIEEAVYPLFSKRKKARFQKSFDS